MDYLDYRSNSETSSYRPRIFRLTNDADVGDFNDLIGNPDLVILDSLQKQLAELLQLRHPRQKLGQDELKSGMNDLLGDLGFHEYGVWAYYPWNNRLIHLVDQADFYELRTSRNQLKITRAEQDELARKKIGIVGLSVGNAIAVTMAMERICGEIRLADFDTLDLTNLNRIRCGIHNLGINKAIITAREIAEIDPFIEVKVFDDGLTPENIGDFFSTGGQLDLIADECDSLEMKFLIRQHARKLGVPVIMETSDRGMLDVERFDIEPDRPFFHGKIAALGAPEPGPIPGPLRMQYLMAIVDYQQISERLRNSYAEIGKSLTTWPQLASAVIMGGGTTTDVSRRILLGQFKSSGRFYFDTELMLQHPKHEA